MSGVIDLTEEDDHAADTEEDEPAQTADVAGGAAAQPVPCCGDRCRSCLRCATGTSTLLLWKFGRSLHMKIEGFY